MDYIEKLNRINEHLKNHPNDYQSVISRMKIYGKAIDNERRLKTIERLKNVARYRRELNEK